MDIIHIKYYIAYIVIYQTPDQSSACTARGYQTPAAVLQELAGGLCWILPVGSRGADVKIIAKEINCATKASNKAEHGP